MYPYRVRSEAERQERAAKRRGAVLEHDRAAVARALRTAECPKLADAIHLRGCAAIDAERRRGDRRAWAHVDHVGRPWGTICVGRGFWQLVQRTRRGILYHEVGHLLIGAGFRPLRKYLEAAMAEAADIYPARALRDQALANAAVYEVLDVWIYYHQGSGLQYVTEEPR